MTILELFTGPAFLLILAGAGLFYTILLKGMQFTRLPVILRETFGRLFRKESNEKGKLTSFQAAATALAGAMGTGNITGVAAALISGGPGAIFWMWSSSLLMTVLKYAEILLSLRFRTKDTPAGPMNYMEKGLHCKSLAVWYAASCVAASFGIGNLAQSKSASCAVSEVLLIPEWIVSGLLAALTGLLIFGGMGKVSKILEYLIPLLSVGYLGGAFWILLRNYALIPDAFRIVFSDALNFQSVPAGFLGFLTARSIRHGIAGGVFSNESGMGTAALIHSEASADNPARQALWGISEVFLDTTIMCTVTALIILISGAFPGTGSSTDMVLTAFSAFMGKGAGIFLAISLFLFGLASIAGWSCCGEISLYYLCRSKTAGLFYRILYAGAVWWAAFLPESKIWKLCDLLNLSAAIPNCIALLFLYSFVKKEYYNFFNVNIQNISRNIEN